ILEEHFGPVHAVLPLAEVGPASPMVRTPIVTGKRRNCRLVRPRQTLSTSTGAIGSTTDNCIPWAHQKQGQRPPCLGQPRAASVVPSRDQHLGGCDPGN